VLSMVVHALLLAAFTVWQVRNTLEPLRDDAGGTKVALVSRAVGESAAGQIRGRITAPSALDATPAPAVDRAAVSVAAAADAEAEAAPMRMTPEIDTARDSVSTASSAVREADRPAPEFGRSGEREPLAPPDGESDVHAPIARLAVPTAPPPVSVPTDEAPDRGVADVVEAADAATQRRRAEPRPTSSADAGPSVRIAPVAGAAAAKAGPAGPGPSAIVRDVDADRRPMRSGSSKREHLPDLPVSTGLAADPALATPASAAPTRSVEAEPAPSLGRTASARIGRPLRDRPAATPGGGDPVTPVAELQPESGVGVGASAPVVPRREPRAAAESAGTPGDRITVRPGVDLALEVPELALALPDAARPTVDRPGDGDGEALAVPVEGPERIAERAGLDFDERVRITRIEPSVTGREEDVMSRDAAEPREAAPDHGSPTAERGLDTLPALPAPEDGLDAFAAALPGPATDPARVEGLEHGDDLRPVVSPEAALRAPAGTSPPAAPSVALMPEHGEIDPAETAVSAGSAPRSSEPKSSSRPARPALYDDGPPEVAWPRLALPDGVTGDDEPRIDAARFEIGGIVLHADTGEPIPDAVVRLDLEGSPRGSAVRTTEGGVFVLRVDEIPEHVAVTASAEGYVPAATNVAERQIERGVWIVFSLAPVDRWTIAVEEDPEVHHLGNDEFTGRINSRFQRRSEGIRLEMDFELDPDQVPPAIEGAELRLLVKGAQNANPVFVNGRRLRETLEDSPADGSFGEFRIPIPPETLRIGRNVLEFRSTDRRGTDLDDFEFVNVRVILEPRRRGPAPGRGSGRVPEVPR